MDSYDVLLIIVSIALIFSMIVWIFVGVLIIQVLRKLKEATATAQHAVENVEAFTESLKNAGKASAVGSIIKQVSKAFKGKGKED